MHNENDQMLLQIREQEKPSIRGNNYHLWLLCAARNQPFFKGVVANYWADIAFRQVTENSFKKGNFSRFGKDKRSLRIGSISDGLPCAEILFTRREDKNVVEIYFAGRLTRTITEFSEWKSYCKNWFLENSFAGDFWNAYRILRANPFNQWHKKVSVGDEVVIWDVTQQVEFSSNLYGWGVLSQQDFQTCTIWQVLSINGCLAECATLAPNGNAIKETFYTCEFSKIFSDENNG